MRQEIIKDLFDKVREDGERIDDKFKGLCKRHQVGLIFKYELIKNSIKLRENEVCAHKKRSIK